MLQVLSKKRVKELKRKIELCDSFIDKEIDADYYTNEKQKCQAEIKRLNGKRKLFLTVGAGLALLALFGLLFMTICYILKQLI